MRNLEHFRGADAATATMAGRSRQLDMLQGLELRSSFPPRRLTGGGDGADLFIHNHCHA